MIELDDLIDKLSLGIKEYIVLKALEVKTIRHILLLDIDRISTLEEETHTIKLKLKVWQNLLRKYITYEKINEARKKENIPEESLKINDSVSEISLKTVDYDILSSLQIETIFQFLNTDLKKVLGKKGCGNKTIDRLIKKQNDLLDSELLENTRLAETTVKRIKKKFSKSKSETEETVSPEKFLKAPLSDSEINSNEVEALSLLNIKTVEDFLDFDVKKVQELKGYSEKTTFRLKIWQKYLNKKLKKAKK